LYCFLFILQCFYLGVLIFLLTFPTFCFSIKNTLGVSDHHSSTYTALNHHFFASFIAFVSCASLTASGNILGLYISLGEISIFLKVSSQKSEKFKA